MSSGTVLAPPGNLIVMYLLKITAANELMSVHLFWGSHSPLYVSHWANHHPALMLLSLVLSFVHVRSDIIIFLYGGERTAKMPRSGLTALESESTPAHKKVPSVLHCQKESNWKDHKKEGGNRNKKGRNRSLAYNENSGKKHSTKF